MICQKKYGVLNHISTKRSISADTPISEGEREVTGVTIIWKGHRSMSAPSVSQGIGLGDLHEGQSDSVSAVENRSVDASLPVKHILSSMIPSAYPSLTLECGQETNQRLPCSTDKLVDNSHAQEEVDVLGNKFESPTENKCQSNSYQQGESSFRQGLKTAFVYSSKELCILQKAYYKSEVRDKEYRYKRFCAEMLKSTAKKTGLPVARVRLWLLNKRILESRLKKRAIKRLEETKEGSETNKSKKKREPFAPWVKEVLQNMLRDSLYLTEEAMDLLVDRLPLNRVQIINWFKYERAKIKLKMRLSIVAPSQEVPAQFVVPPAFYGGRRIDESKTVPETSNKVGTSFNRCKVQSSSESARPMPSAALGAAPLETPLLSAAPFVCRPLPIRIRMQPATLETPWSTPLLSATPSVCRPLPIRIRMPPAALETPWPMPPLLEEGRFHRPWL